MAHLHHSQYSSSGVSSVSSAYRQRNVTSTSFNSYNRKTEKVVENLMSSIDEKKKEIIDLNNKLSTFLITIESRGKINTRLSEEIKQMKMEFSQTESDIRDGYNKQIKDMRSSLSQLSEKLSPLQAEVDSLKKEIEKKDIENNSLHDHINNIENDLRKQVDMQFQIDDMREKMRSDKDYFMSERQQYLTKEIKAQYENDKLSEEREYLEKSSQAEIEQLLKMLSKFEVVQQNLEDVYKAEFAEALKIIKEDHNAELDKLRKEKYGSYEDHKSRQDKERFAEKQSFYSYERNVLQEQIHEQENEFHTLMESLSKVRPEELDPVISTYRELLVKKTEKRESSEPEEEEKNKIKEASATSSVKQTSSSTEHQADSNNIQTGLMHETTGLEAGYKNMDTDARKDMQQTSSVEQKSSSSDDPEDQLDYRR